MTYELACEVICAVRDGDSEAFSAATSKLDRGNLFELVAMLAAMVPSDSQTPAAVVQARSRVCRVVTAAPHPTGTEFAVVVERVAALFEVRVADLFSGLRRTEVTDAQHVICWIASNVLRQSYSEIGRRVSRDHTSVIYAVRRVEHDQRLRTRAAIVATSLAGVAAA